MISVTIDGIEIEFEYYKGEIVGHRVCAPHVEDDVPVNAWAKFFAEAERIIEKRHAVA